MSSLKPLGILFFSRARYDLIWVCALTIALLFLRIPLSNFTSLAGVEEFSNRIENVLYSLLPLLGFIYSLKWFSGFQDGDISAGKQSCMPEFLLYSPLTTVKLAVIPTVCGLIAVSLSRFISAPELISNEGLIAILSSTAVYFWVQAILWQNFSVRFVRAILIIVIIAVAYVANIHYRNLATTNINTTLALCLLAFAVFGFLASYLAIKYSRRGAVISFSRFFSKGKAVLSLNTSAKIEEKVSNLRDYKSAFAGQVKYESGSHGYFLPTIFSVIIFSPLLTLFLSHGEDVVRKRTFDLYFFSLIFMPIAILCFVGFGRGVLVTNRSFQRNNFSDFLAVLPMSSYKMLNAKFTEMSFSCFLYYGIYFILCSLCFQKYSEHFIDLILESRSPFVGYSLVATVVFCSLTFGALAYMSLPWLGSLLCKHQHSKKTQMLIIGFGLMIMAFFHFVVGPYIKNFTADDIPDVKMMIFILSALKIIAVLWSIKELKKLNIPLVTLKLFFVSWSAVLLALTFIGYQLFSDVWRDIYYIISLAFLSTPILGILFSYIIFTKSRYQ